MTDTSQGRRRLKGQSLRGNRADAWWYANGGSIDLLAAEKPGHAAVVWLRLNRRTLLRFLREMDARKRKA